MTSAESDPTTKTLTDLTIRHGKYTIAPTDPLPPIPTWRQFAWNYVHDDYDGPEDNRHGYAASPEACIAEIEERDD